MKISLKPVLVGFCISILVTILSGFTFVDWQWWVATTCLLVVYLVARDNH